MTCGLLGIDLSALHHPCAHVGALCSREISSAGRELQEASNDRRGTSSAKATTTTKERGLHGGKTADTPWTATRKVGTCFVVYSIGGEHCDACVTPRTDPTKRACPTRRSRPGPGGRPASRPATRRSGRGYDSNSASVGSAFPCFGLPPLRASVSAAALWIPKALRSCSGMCSPR